jgi:hypothetical protein
MLEQQKVYEMDREQHNRVVINSNIKKLIDEWHICPFSDDAAGLFQSLRICTESYVNGKGQLTMSVIANIVWDLREVLNSHCNKNLTHFTDLICDSILLEYKGITPVDLPDFNNLTFECEAYCYSKF